MGYTHYWGRPRIKVKEDNLITIRGYLDTILKTNHEIISFDSDIMQTPELYIDWASNFVNLRFNGIREDGYETFMAQPTRSSTFCKTDRRPYDKVVCQVLLIYQHFFDIDLSSDGFCNVQPKGRTYEVGNVVDLEHLDGTWGESLQVVNKLLGTNYEFVVNSVYGDGKYFSYIPT